LNTDKTKKGTNLSDCNASVDVGDGLIFRLKISIVNEELLKDFEDAVCIPALNDNVSRTGGYFPKTLAHVSTLKSVEGFHRLVENTFIK
jgi:hypothetical protein